MFAVESEGSCQANVRLPCRSALDAACFSAFAVVARGQLTVQLTMLIELGLKDLQKGSNSNTITCANYSICSLTQTSSMLIVQVMVLAHNGRISGCMLIS